MCAVRSVTQRLKMDGAAMSHTVSKGKEVDRTAESEMQTFVGRRSCEPGIITGKLTRHGACGVTLLVPGSCITARFLFFGSYVGKVYRVTSSCSCSVVVSVVSKTSMSRVRELRTGQGISKVVMDETIMDSGMRGCLGGYGRPCVLVNPSSSPRIPFMSGGGRRTKGRLADVVLVGNFQGLTLLNKGRSCGIAKDECRNFLRTRRRVKISIGRGLVFVSASGRTTMSSTIGELLRRNTSNVIYVSSIVYDVYLDDLERGGVSIPTRVGVTDVCSDGGLRCGGPPVADVHFSAMELKGVTYTGLLGVLKRGPLRSAIPLGCRMILQRSAR